MEASPSPTPEYVFEEFVRNVPTFGILHYKDYGPWTKAVTSFFNEWGKKLGNYVFCKPSYGGPGEYMELDLVWIRKEGFMSFIDLALEYENEVLKIEDILNGEFQKLMAIKSILKILITYPGEMEQELIGKIAWSIKYNMLKLNEEKYLIIVGHAGENKGPDDPFVQFRAYLFDSSGNQVWKKESGTIPTK